MWNVALMLLAACVSTQWLAEAAPQYSYSQDGRNWGGLCVSSRRQSPINLVTSRFTPAVASTAPSLAFGTGTNVKVLNLGNQVKVTWTQAEPSTATTTLGAFYGQPNVTGPIFAPNSTTSLGRGETVMDIVPTQFHFHTYSEHTMNGKLSAMELHLVTNVTAANTSCNGTCFAVFGVLYDFGPDGILGNDFLEPFLDAIPPSDTGNNVTNLANDFVLNLTQLLPTDTSQYVQYTGSLTTPPCSEGISWTVFTETQRINVEQVRILQNVLANATGDNFIAERTDNRLPQPLYERTLWLYGSPSTGAATSG